MGKSLLFYDIDEYIRRTDCEISIFINTKDSIFLEHQSMDDYYTSNWVKYIKHDIATNHDGDRTMRWFNNHLFPKRIYMWDGWKEGKKGILSALKQNLDNYKIQSFGDEIKKTLLNFLYHAYQSDKTQFLEESGEVKNIDLSKTLDLKLIKLPDGSVTTYFQEIVKILEDALICFGKIDSFERLTYRDNVHGGVWKTQNTIITACDNPYERFYNYYKNEYKIEIKPQLRLEDGVFRYYIPSSRSTDNEEKFRKLIIDETGIDPNQYVYKPPKREDPTENKQFVLQKTP